MRRLLSYLLVLVLFGSGIALILRQGRTLSPRGSSEAHLQPSLHNAGELAGVEPSASLVANLRENFQDPLNRLLVQLILVVLAARLCGMLARRLRQPAVIGELIAGILLGPSLLGWVWPELFQFIFAPSSLGSLRLFSQIGLCLFMFVVRMELDTAHLKHQARIAVLVSQVIILCPYFLGLAA